MFSLILHFDSYKQLDRAVRKVDDLDGTQQRRAKHARDKFEQVLDNPDDHWRGTRDVQIGLIERDSGRVTNGIERIVAYHKEHVEDMPRWRELLPLSASVYVLVARDYGLEIDIESEYLPDAIRQYSIDERITLPQPDYLKDHLRVPAGSISAE
ncbi:MULTISPECIES: Imm49 family immunity protein [Haloarcula]|uniref:Uncharacterized protein n=1 Tax=Haloarcula japonica (strain ATCC 49778 / DSM 6131 / JCM 7785 / NBRC 101032 / NCIMB 13157 / TR-1) TaxID=1227453 RepID=M0L3V0_HALJT|nr:MULTISPECIES: Imm49 family immunity protein [Haloarcula]EMA27109.1 hypothetical protein C444_21041 [Haloarcula japonica DSM 6131]MDQ2074809.1 immunity 49 family protein [Haloarcula sp. H-GB4]